MKYCIDMQYFIQQFVPKRRKYALICTHRNRLREFRWCVPQQKTLRNGGVVWIGL